MNLDLWTVILMVAASAVTWAISYFKLGGKINIYRDMVDSFSVEIKDVVDAFISSLKPDSDGVIRITTDEAAKIKKEVEDVIAKFSNL